MTGMKKKLFLIIVAVTLVGILPSLLYNEGRYLPEADFVNQQIPFIYETKRMLSSGIPLWSWNHFFGDNFIGAYSFYTLTSPFVWIDCLFPYRYLVWGIMLTLLLKMICCGWVSYAYLRKMQFSDRLCAIGALMYTFSSWAITNLFYYHFMEPMICFPLLLMAIEHYLSGGRQRHVLLALATFAVAFVNYYFLVCSLLAAALYAFSRVIKGGYERKVRLVGVAVGDVLLGVGLAAFLLLPVFLYLSGGPRENFGLGGDWKVNLAHITQRALWMFTPKITEVPDSLFHVGYGWKSAAASLPVVGVFFALLYIIRHRDWLSLLLVVSLVVYLTPLNGIFTLFTNPFYVRWGYALTLFFVVATLYVLRDATFSLLDFKWYAVVACGVVVVVYGINVGWYFKHNERILQYANVPIEICSLLLFAISLVLLYCYVRTRRTGVLFWGMVVCAALQFAASSAAREPWLTRWNVAQRDPDYVNKQLGDQFHKQYIISNDYPRGNGTFTSRTDFIAGKQGNLLLLTNHPSVEGFSSCQNKKSMLLMLSADTTKVMSRNRFIPSCHRTAFDALMSVETVVDYYKDPLPQTTRPSGLTLQKHTCNYNIYCYDHYIPMGFTYTSYVAEEVVERLSLSKDTTVDVPLVLLAHLSVSKGDEALFAKYLSKGNISESLSIDSLCQERRRHTCDQFAGDTHGFNAHISLPRANFVFFSVPADPGFQAYVDGKQTKIYDVSLGQSAILVPKGGHDIRFEFLPQGIEEGSVVSLGCLLCLIVVGVGSRRQSLKSMSS